jgi:hypothetical protein
MMAFVLKFTPFSLLFKALLLAFFDFLQVLVVYLFALVDEVSLVILDMLLLLKASVIFLL